MPAERAAAQPEAADPAGFVADVTVFRTGHHGRPEAQELADRCQREIDVWKAYPDYYSYAFFVARAR